MTVSEQVGAVAKVLDAARAWRVAREEYEAALTRGGLDAKAAEGRYFGASAVLSASLVELDS